MDFLRRDFMRRMGRTGSTGPQQQQQEDVEALAPERQLSRGSDSDAGSAQVRAPEMQERGPSLLRRFSITTSSLPSIPSLFSGRGSGGMGRSPGQQQQQQQRWQRRRRNDDETSAEDDDSGEESPKTPRFSIGMPSLPSTRLHLPHLQRTWTNGSAGPDSRPGTAVRPSTAAGRPSMSRARDGDAAAAAAAAAAATGGVASGAPLGMDMGMAITDDAIPAMPSAAATRVHARRRFNGADPAELHLAALAEDGRERRQRRRDRAHGRRHRHHRHHGEHSRQVSRSGNAEGTEDGAATTAVGGATEQGEGGSGEGRRHKKHRKERPRKFLFCFPWIRSRRVRSQILRCFVSGLFLTLLLAVYLALSITKNIMNSEFTVLLILIILFTTIFFCHGLIRLCMLIVRPRNDESSSDPMRARGGLMHHAAVVGPGGYAIPRRPIRVVLARDEEAAGLESEATKTNPPAYGLWRESVRVDPNRIFWQRSDDVVPPNLPTMRGGVGGSEAPSDPGSSSPDANVSAISNLPPSSPSTSDPAASSAADRRRSGSSSVYSGPRPPSYVSEDGVSYVVNAAPRSIAPTTDVPLPPHPAERGAADWAGRQAAW